MTETDRKPSPARMYKVAVEGTLKGVPVSWFETLSISQEPGCTIITGVMRDQTELHGLLRRIHDLHLTLRSVETID